MLAAWWELTNQHVAGGRCDVEAQDPVYVREDKLKIESPSPRGMVTVAVVDGYGCLITFDPSWVTNSNGDGEAQRQTLPRQASDI